MLLYASWSFIMFLITLSITLVNRFDVNRQMAHTIVLFILLVKLIAYFFVENFLAYRYCKFVFAPWIVYGLFLVEAVLKPSLIRPPILDVLSSFSINNDFLFLKANYDFFFKILLLTFFVFLCLAKLVKFIWNEIFYQNKLFNY
jgi:hypothetical protein